MSMTAHMEVEGFAPNIVDMFSLGNKQNIMYVILMQKDISRKIGRVQFADAIFVQKTKCNCIEKKYIILGKE